MRVPWRRPVSRTDAPTLGFVDTWKRRHASPSETQRDADIEAALREGTWTPTEKDHSRIEGSVDPRDKSGINPSGVIDESMTNPQRA
jgi:hypothetical protein